MFLIDTDVLSALSRRQRDPNIEAWFRRQRNSQLFLSVITLGEIERGIALRERTEPAFAALLAAWLDQVLSAYRERILPFDLAAARRWSLLSATLGNDSADLQIAATAIEHGLTVVTRNVSDVRPTGVDVVNPFIAASDT